MRRRMKAQVFGRVQGVTFRYFTYRKARGLGLVGEVKNLDDGSVKVVAEGEELNLNELLLYLKNGPVWAKVLEVKTTFSEPKNEFREFNIAY